jgi:hypothetical protein
MPAQTVDAILPIGGENNPIVRGRGNKERRFFKRMSPEIRKAIDNQMGHVRKGCLSDPPKELVSIHRINPVNGKGFSARSTGTNENDNMFLNRLLNTPSIGLARAERVISDHYEQSNGKKEVSRQGGPEHITARTEKLYTLNSVAKSCGIKDDDLPVRERVSIPRSLDEVEEFLGMQYSLLEWFRSALSDKEDEGEDGKAVDADMANFLAGIDFEHDDVPVDPAQFGVNMEAENTEVGRGAEDLTINLPEINHNESTFEAFKRLTEQHPWVPFTKPDKPRSDMEEEEYAYFREEESKYNRHCAYLNARNGYGTFARNWDIEVATRFKDQASGNPDGKPLMNRKTALQLQEHYDRLQKHLQQAELVRPNDAFRDRLEHVFTSTRRNRGELQASQNSGPNEYRQEGLPAFGNPTTLNTNIAAAAFQYNQNAGMMTNPFVLRPVVNKQSATVFLGPNFNRNKYCWKCGFQKKMHNDYGVPFGHNCVNNCLREDCSKCGQRREFHHTGLFGMGPSCIKPPHINSPYHGWYKK